MDLLAYPNERRLYRLTQASLSPSSRLSRFHQLGSALPSKAARRNPVSRKLMKINALTGIRVPVSTLNSTRFSRRLSVLPGLVFDLAALKTVSSCACSPYSERSCNPNFLFPRFQLTELFARLLMVRHEAQNFFEFGLGLLGPVK